MRRGKWNRGQMQTAQMVRGGFCVATAKGAGSLLSGDEGHWKMSISVTGTTDQDHPTLARQDRFTCMSYLKTGGPGKQRGTHKLRTKVRIRERSKGVKGHQSVCPTNPPNPSGWSPSWLRDAHATRKAPVSERLARDSPQTNPITIKPKALSQQAEPFPGAP